ncbi:FAD-dependent oxidoreductase [Cuneatibacter caecimuris]|uniref:Glycine/D-amino acid oxidase-like deaminating enzyme n=1 Tax=Cuneatibacter caecimuris TaxID=1796618 RepID=A0A4Q7PK52_9FIRM|nr:glycine/D-amino acid oxidase-like deaminating enzyme [Cuneatibacter caecimuris]
MESIWKQTAKPLKTESSAQLPEKAEAVVIGAGLAGVLTAWFLNQQGVQTVVLEAGRTGSGQTCNTTAKVTSQHSIIYSKLEKTMGQKAAWLYARANEEAISQYRSLIRDLDIQCGWKECPAYLYSEKESKSLEEEARAAAAAGIRSEFVEKTELPFPVRGAVRFSGQAQFHPLQFLYALAGRLKIYEHTDVLRVEGDQVYTSRGNIRAGSVIFATHYPFPIRPGYYFMRMHQERSYCIAVEGAMEPDGMYLGIDSGGLSFRSYGKYLVLGGGQHRTGENPAGGQYEVLYQQARQLWPSCSLQASWSAQDCMTLDGIPYIGKFSNKVPHWYVATGFGKWGMTSSMAAAQLISDAVLHRENPCQEIYSPQRKTIRASAGNFLKDGVHAVKDLSRRFLQIPKETLGHIQPGHGGIVSYKGEKIGVYKDEEGKCYLVHAACPHLGCQLEWNPAEKSWDCPCHGSRFNYQGHLLDNPAQEELKHEIIF